MSEFEGQTFETNVLISPRGGMPIEYVNKRCKRELALELIEKLELDEMHIIKITLNEEKQPPPFIGGFTPPFDQWDTLITYRARMGTVTVMEMKYMAPAVMRPRDMKTTELITAAIATKELKDRIRRKWVDREKIAEQIFTNISSKISDRLYTITRLAFRPM